MLLSLISELIFSSDREEFFSIFLAEEEFDF
jgi:hypothetical protein